MVPPTEVDLAHVLMWLEVWHRAGPGPPSPWKACDHQETHSSLDQSSPHVIVKGSHCTVEMPPAHVRVVVPGCHRHV